MTHSNTNGKIIGWLIALVGALLFLLRNLEIIDFEFLQYLFTWQMLIAILGLVLIANKDYTKGMTMLIVALFFWFPSLKEDFPNLLVSINTFNYYSTYWPIPIILICIINLLGIVMKDRAQKPDKFKSEYNYAISNDDNNLNNEVVFTNYEQTITSHSFTGGQSKTIFGHQVIDLSKSELRGEFALLRLEIILAQCIIVVPENWKVTIKTEGVFGKTTDKRISKGKENGPEIHITGPIVFGSLELIN